MSDTRETIFANLVAGLKTILKSEDYNNNVQTVTTEKITDVQARNIGLPAISVWDNGDTFLKSIGDYNIETINVQLKAFIGGDDINPLLADIRKYINSASLGSNVHEVKTIDVPTPVAGEEKADFVVDVSIRYFYDRSNP